MYRYEDLQKIVKIFIVVMLCCEMQTSETQLDSYEHRILQYRRDVNGTEATFSNSKYHASIRLKDQDARFGEGHICSGALIAPSVILTAASCVYDYDNNKPYHPSELKVVLGSIKRYQQHEHSLIYSVTHSYQPQTFDSIMLRDNLAILMLESDVPEIVENIKPTKWQRHNNKWYSKESQQNLKVTTWLKTNENLFVNPLMILTAKATNDAECLKLYAAAYGPGMLCINTSESLVQDLGSPLFVDSKLIGVMSFNNGAAQSSVYTEIAHHTKWIQEKIGNGRNQNSSVWGMLGFLALTWMALKRVKYWTK